MPFTKICSKILCMKEFLKTKKVTYNLMSFTAFKAMLLFSYLLEAPRSYEEIRQHFEAHEFLHESISIDTLRVYINSLERLGCEVVRGKKAEGSKYRLVKHPFQVNISNEHAKNLIKIFKTLSKSIDVEDLIAMTNFFEKIAKEINSDELKTALVNVSPLKKINSEILEILISACHRNDEISFEYNSPSSSKKNIELIAENLKITNNKLYLSGYSPQYKDPKATFLVSRITQKPVIKLTKTIVSKAEPLTVGCEIYEENVPLNDNEKIIKTENGHTFIEITSDNKFFTIQRILSFGNNCKVLYPQSFKEDICSVLKKMKEEYIAEKI